MIINYDDFETNICWEVNSLLWSSCREGQNRSYYVSAVSDQGTYNPLFDYWDELTASLRYGP